MPDDTQSDAAAGPAVAPFDPNKPFKRIAPPTGFDPNKPFRRITPPQQQTHIVTTSPDDNLARAARDFQELQRIGLAGQPGEPYKSVAPVIGKGIELMRKGEVGGLADIGGIFGGQAFRDLQALSPQATTEDKLRAVIPNFMAIATGEALPAEQQKALLPVPARIAAGAGQGLAGSVPQLAAVAGAEAVGIPPMVSGPAVFGFTPEGFSKEDAAIAFSLPYVGRYSGQLAGTIARKFGVSTANALNMIKAVGGITGAAGYLATIDESKLENLPTPEMRHIARLDMLAGLIGQAALGPMGVEFEKITPGEMAGRVLAEGVRESRQPAGAAAPPELGRLSTYLQSRENVQAVAGGEPKVQELLSPTQLQDLNRELLQSYRTAEIQRAQQVQAENLARKPAGEKAVVPETPAEPQRDEPVLAEIRRKNARTIRQIQQLFPQRQLSREEARQFRNEAWGAPSEEGPQPGAGPPKPQAPVAAEVPSLDQAHEGTPPVPQSWAGEGNRRVRVQLADGRVIPALWNGYYQFPGTKYDGQPSLATVMVTGGEARWSHGFQLPAGARILDTIPSYQEWLVSKQTPPKSPDAPTAATGLAGSPFSVTTPIEGVPVKGNYTVLEADQLKTSFDAGYDPRLQPRDRTRVASRWQLAEMLKRPDVNRLGESPTSDLGSPMIDESNQVLTGNLRTRLIRAMYDTGKDDDYRQWLLQNARDFGLDPEAVRKMARPVLVRRVTNYGSLGTGDAAKIEFARQSNQQQVAPMSAGEKAASDARLLIASPQMLALFRPGEDGNVLAASNREFLNAFVEGTGDKGELLTADGYNGPVLSRRVENAVLSAMLGTENQALVNTLIDEADRWGLKTAGKAVMSAAPALLRYRETPYDLSGYLGQALKDLVRIRQSGMKLADFLGTQEMFSNRSLSSDLILDSLASERSAARMGERLQAYAKAAAEGLKDVETPSILGLPPITREQLVQRIYGPTEGPTGPRQTDLPPGGAPPGVPPGGQPSGPGAGGPVQGGPQTLTGAPGGEPNQPTTARAQGPEQTDLIPPPSGKAQANKTRPEPTGEAGTATKGAESPVSKSGRQKRSKQNRSQTKPEAGIAGSVAFETESQTSAPKQAGSVASEEVPGRQRPGALQGRLSGSARAQAQAERGLRAQEQQANSPLTRSALQLVNRTSAQQKRPLFFGLRKYFAPQTIDEEAATMAGILRAALGREYENARRADFALHEFRREFDRTPVARTWQYDPTQPLPRNYEVMRAIDTGDTRNLTPIETQFAQEMRRLFDEAIDQVHSVSPHSLRNLIENYFPRIWQDADNPNVRNKINQLLARRPWEGPKSFLLKRVLEYFTDGLGLGLRPVSDNPVDVTLQKLGEMYRFVATRGAMEQAKNNGLRKFIYTYEQKPAGWVKVQDPSSDVWAPPLVTRQEAFDEMERVKTLEMLESLGIPHERRAKIGGRRWGYARLETGETVTKFGGPTDVIWHEAGHIIDVRYPELAHRLGAHSPNSAIGKELAALADLRYEGKSPSRGYRDYVREKVEKMANVFQAYLRVPEKFQRTAPTVWREFLSWLDEHPEVKVPLNEVAQSRSLVLGTAETEERLPGPVKLGDWYMPEGAGQVLTNYLQPGLGRFQWFRTTREIASLLNGVQLLGFFHGQFVSNDSFYSGIGLAFYDVLKGKPVRALQEIVQVPVSPFTSLYRGHKIKAAIENPAGAAANYAAIGKLATEVNLRAGHGNYEAEFARRWSRAFNEALRTPNTGAVWEAFWRTPFAAADLAMKPVMQFLVPRMKLGIFARMAERVIADNPNASPEALRQLLAQAADATEDRLGQVTYDNIHQARTIKDAGQLAMRAYGWQLTKYRMIVGGSADWMRAGSALLRGQKPDVTFRMTYLPAMVLGHAILGSIIMYALTGRRPQKLVDYLFPDTGLVDANGNQVRISIADFVKDVIADSAPIRHLSIKEAGAEFSRKLGPFWNMLAEAYRNEDFYGTKIFEPRQFQEPELQAVVRHLREAASFFAREGQPFSASAGDRFAQAGANPALARLGPFFGFVPAPRYAVQTPAQSRASEIMQELLPRGARSPDQAAHAKLVSDLVRDLRTGKVNTEGQFEQRVRAASVKNQAELTAIRQRATWSPLQYQVHRMPVDKAMEVWDLADDKERLSLAPFLAEKLDRAYKGGALTPDKASAWARLVAPYLAKAKAQPAPARRYSAFGPAPATP